MKDYHSPFLSLRYIERKNGGYKPCVAGDSPENKRKEFCMLKIFLRQNMTATAKAKYNFRSENEAEITFEHLINEMAANNTTVTKADISGVLDVYKSVVLRYAQLGYTVRGPLGLVYVTAGGTTDDNLSSFQPGLTTNDHSLNLRFLPDAAVSRSVLANTMTERVSNRKKMIPNIESVINADGNEENVIKAGDTIRILGDYLKFDTEDETQGIFIEKDGVSKRLDYYAWNTNKRVDTRIPADTEAGSYTLSISAKPCTVQYTESFADEIEIS